MNYGGTMKTIFLLTLVLVNLLCIYHVHKISNSINTTLQSYKTDVDTRMSKFDVLLSDVDVVKQIVGWKTTEIESSFCLGGTTKYSTEGAFSFVTKTPDYKCYGHEFTKLNDMVESLELLYVDGKFSGLMREAKADGLAILQKYGNIKEDDLKTTIKEVLKRTTTTEKKK